jgi:hypothetical protein
MWIYCAAIMPSISLAQGEYFIWSSPRSNRKMQLSMRQVGVMFMVSPYVFGMVVALGYFTGWPGLLALAAFIAGIVAFVRWYRRRPTFFVTNQRLIDAGLFGLREIPIASIQGCERYIQEVRTRFGLERITTDVLLIMSAGQCIKVGPVFDFDSLWEFIHHAVLRDTIQISALPALDGGESPAEKRNDILLVLSTKTDGDVYGPLFIGPTKIIRFTEKLPSLLEWIMLTVAAGGNTAEELEVHMLQLVKHPNAGHSTVLDREMTAASMQGNQLELTEPQRAISMELRPADVTRTAAFLRMWRPAHPMR